MSISRGFDSARASRREFLLGAAAGLVAAGHARGADTVTQSAAGFRFVHLADIHVQPEQKGAEGFRQCLAHVHALAPRPDFILTGGDLVMDALNVPEERAKALYDLFVSICRDSDIPIRHCIGNHEVFGWESQGRISPRHALYGKKMAQERLGLERLCYSFDHKGWHFCILDDILPREGGYDAGLAAEDLDWLARDLKAAGDRPKVVCAHIPFVSVAALRDVNGPMTGTVPLPVPKSVRNPGPILRLFREHRVQLALTGHLHDLETCRYEHTTYVGQGAVSGAWWNGPRNLTVEGYGIIDVRPDGTFEHRYQSYGWQAKPQKA